MFSGIIQKTGRVLSADEQGGGRIVRIEKPRAWRLRKGASVAVDGICSTVRASGAKHFEVEYMPETLSKTAAVDFAKGRVVNLERSLRLSDLVDGHVVQGHVDGRGIITAIRLRGTSKELMIRIPRSLVRFVAPRGSVAINGVSLTVACMQGASCTVALVSYTLAHTNLGALAVGDSVNIETDLIARYLAQLGKK